MFTNFLFQSPFCNLKEGEGCARTFVWLTWVFGLHSSSSINHRGHAAVEPSGVFAPAVHLFKEIVCSRLRRARLLIKVCDDVTKRVNGQGTRVLQSLCLAARQSFLEKVFAFKSPGCCSDFPSWWKLHIFWFWFIDASRKSCPISKRKGETRLQPVLLTETISNWNTQ